MEHTLDATALAAAVPRRWLVASVTDSTGSTNADAAAAARAGVATGSVFVSGHQSAGRGRFTRRWEAPAGAALAVSVVVRPTIALERWGWIPLLAGMAAAEGIRLASGLDARVKWPNDVLIGGLKVCGILAERVEDAAIIGMGVNLTLTRDQLPVPTATSLLLAGSDASALAVTTGLLARLDAWLTRWEAGVDLRRDYERACDTVGRSVRVISSPKESVEGRALGVGVDGQLLVEVDGAERGFPAGDVWHLR
jgi:BirA family transcriptional regulator, biotin operon repressor / biotin---[acetyl-CoA-carboxylase] ligase